ncbi:MAG: hypothetical protein HWD61_14600 [Parachlamydiaceae bacterium]|nr:MAG: hypothetical protein HWD61_14600 [Parachlamydiaceae bacterium]
MSIYPFQLKLGILTASAVTAFVSVYIAQLIQVVLLRQIQIQGAFWSTFPTFNWKGYMREFDKPHIDA